MPTTHIYNNAFRATFEVVGLFERAVRNEFNEHTGLAVVKVMENWQDAQGQWVEKSYYLPIQVAGRLWEKAREMERGTLVRATGKLRHYYNKERKTSRTVIYANRLAIIGRIEFEPRPEQVPPPQSKPQTAQEVAQEIELTGGPPDDVPFEEIPM